MAVTATPIFAQTPKTYSCNVTAANTTYVGGAPANTVLLVTPALTNGGLIIRAWAKPQATVTATKLQLFRSPDGGTTAHFVASALMAAYTHAETTDSPEVDFGFSAARPLLLSSSDTLYAGAGVATGDFTFSCEVYAF